MILPFDCFKAWLPSQKTDQGIYPRSFPPDSISTFQVVLFVDITSTQTQTQTQTGLEPGAQSWDRVGTGTRAPVALDPCIRFTHKTPMASKLEMQLPYVIYCHVKMGKLRASWAEGKGENRQELNEF